MARKPNYRFERSERERQKAAKKAERLASKRAKATAGEDEETPQPSAEPPQDQEPV